NRRLEHVDAALATRTATDRRMRQFVTDASHELRTPLASIQGYAELTRQESDVLPPLTESSLARIEAEAARMTMLVGDLLLLSRLDEGQGGLRSEPVDLCNLGQVAVNDARTVSPNWVWRTTLPDESVFVDGDHSAITQIVTNLLRNATTHTPENTRVTLRVDPPRDGFVELVVADSGPGVDPDFVPTLFERFARNDRSRSRRHGSTGLGLAIVAALVDAHGGSIRYRHGDVTAAGADARTPGVSGTGASFIVRLPAWSDEAADAGSPGAEAVEARVS
ncbi:MAG: sensor histidine kinase, partial [Pseudoclavibacter sp.]